VIYLLDTHAFVWWLDDDPKLGKKARAALSSPSASVLVSAVSIWEMAIKLSLGKLRMRKSDAAALHELPTRCGFTDLPIHARHASAVLDLPRHHPDPFDRMLIAQALAERSVLVTSDESIEHYDVRTLDAQR
jgi:PIN domain nuclease of toxin-antitoxin system